MWNAASNSGGMSMISIEGLSYAYSSGTEALKDVSMSFQPAHILGILGESGSGKTTLLKCIGRFLKPDAGRILLDGRDIQTMDEITLRRTVGIVFQKLYLFPHLSVLENLMLAPMKGLKQNRVEVLEAAGEMLDRLGISDLKDSYPSQISGGQAQRAAIARSLMLRPEYLLLDEPTSALDMVTTESFGTWLLELKTDTTFIIVTHDVPFASKVASSGFLLADGRIRARGSIEEIVGASMEAE
jgi:ABC-type polar amino acid transport system ATPase subunit